MSSRSVPYDFLIMNGILLNGTSSSGKTTIANAILRQSDIPFVRLCIDDFLAMIDFRHIDCEAVDGITPECERLVLGFQLSIKAMIDAGNVVLVDHVLQEPKWKEHLLNLLAGSKLLYVGVRCPIVIVEQREKTRGDREIGLAASQFDRVHTDVPYALQVDSSAQSPDECAGNVLSALSRHSSNTAARP